MYVDQMSAAHLPLTNEGRYVFSRLRVEKERCGVAVVTGKVASTCSGMDRFGYKDACILCMHPVRPMTKDTNYRTKVKGYKN